MASEENGSAQPTVEQIAEAEKYKGEANEFFKSTKFNLKGIFSQFFKILIFTDKVYDKAIELYTKAIELDPSNAVYYANRSLANLRKENFG